MQVKYEVTVAYISQMGAILVLFFKWTFEPIDLLTSFLECK